ncbi:hypothetical protein TNCV_2187621 [Trichonephila clavipes]|uniref:Uncharacterized protein n=1 Tax=Trichonephila clavata TaxID=2740835 RepID=A0A8X6L2M8_TRICU|nr:hypothetical protein TNCT_454511 [Trichonephila clavata]GFW06427.1 hypothetical protein TNCV_2187621 [Trichonephila clavipes]
MFGLNPGANPLETPRSSFLVAASDLESPNSSGMPKGPCARATFIHIWQRYFFSSGDTENEANEALTTSTGNAFPVLKADLRSKSIRKMESY